MYTNLEQSKRLAEILPPESADMHYATTLYMDEESDWEVQLSPIPKLCSMYIVNLPCWSLTALLNYLRETDLFPEIDADEHSVKMTISYYDTEETKLLKPVHSITVEKESFIDACYEIIVKLNESK